MTCSQSRLSASVSWLTNRTDDAALLQLPQLRHAALLEPRIADRQRLVDDQDVGSTLIATENASRTYMPDE